MGRGGHRWAEGGGGSLPGLFKNTGMQQKEMHGASGATLIRVLPPDAEGSPPPSPHSVQERRGLFAETSKGQSWLTQLGATSVECKVKTKEEKEATVAGGINKRA